MLNWVNHKVFFIQTELHYIKTKINNRARKEVRTSTLSFRLLKAMIVSGRIYA
jgi:hypothetical protein